MIQFREKIYSSSTKNIKKYLKDNKGKIFTGAVSVASLGLGVGNFATNQKRIKQDKKYQEKQVAATERLTKALVAEARVREKETILAAKNFEDKVNNRPYEETTVDEKLREIPGVVFKPKK